MPLYTPNRWRCRIRCLLFFLVALAVALVGHTAVACAQDSILSQLAHYFSDAPGERQPLADQRFARLPLDRAGAQAVVDRCWQDRQATLRSERAGEMEAREIVLGDLRMPFVYKTFGEPADGGRRLFISLHGGGEMPAEVNDRQWENQQRLYEPAEGVYLVPRAPTNSWNMWHQAHIDEFFGRLIENMIVFEGVDPNRVYLLGYSAGGDGVFQLTPRMADRFAAAAMMAGHPNETSPLGLRNLGFTLHMGENDAAFGRNGIAVQWREALEKLQGEDPQGYPHHVQIHAGKGHWMDRDDRVALPWLAKFARNPFPNRVVWQQDDVTHERCYWLGVPPGTGRGGTLVVAAVQTNTITIEKSEGVDVLQLWLSDALVDLDQPLRVFWGDRLVWEGTAERTVATISQSLSKRDRAACATAFVEVRRDAELDAGPQERTRGRASGQSPGS